MKENKRLSKKEYLEQRKNKFLKRYVCKICGSPLSLVQGTNVMMCNNGECKGIERKYYENGKEKTAHDPFYMLLDERGIQIADSIFNS